MIKSMTGFGRSTLTQEGREYQVEMKSVNHRYHDISIKLPRSISYLEEMIKQIVANETKRGKIDVFVTFENHSQEGKKIAINKEIAKLYIDNLKELAEEEHIGSSIEVTDISKLPDVLMIQNEQDDETIQTELTQVVKEAVQTLVQMRTMEGEKLANDLRIRIQNIRGMVDEILKLSTGLIEDYIVKLEERIKVLLKTEDIDPSRLAQEVVIYADKCSVEEEITRLRSHIDQFEQWLQTNEPIGKKLDFLVQEMNRETNTIGSKANHLEITNHVIQIKTELENIREQIQNIE